MNPDLARLLMKVCCVFLLLAVLAGCHSSPQTPTNAPPAATVPPARLAPVVPAVAAVLGDYEGAMGGKFPFRLSITASRPDSQLVGIYYYLNQQKPIELQGFVAPTGEIWLREFAHQPSAEEVEKMDACDKPYAQVREPVARFMVRRAPDGSLVGTWQDARSGRRLPVQFTHYQSRGPATQAHVGEQRYFEEFTVPVFTVPDPGVTRQLWEIFGIEQLTEMSLDELRGDHRSHKSESTAAGFGGVYSRVTYNRQGLLSVDLHSEYTAANVNHIYRTAVVDLHTGKLLTDEINPVRKAQFLAACEQKLQAQLATYIAEEYPNATPGSENVDIEGLRRQHVSPQNQPDELGIGAASVRFHYPVKYEMQSGMMFKQFQNQFWLEFSFAELKPLLKPGSPLHRLL
jgi:hypothetical protein